MIPISDDGSVDSSLYTQDSESEGGIWDNHDDDNVSNAPEGAQLIPPDDDDNNGTPMIGSLSTMEAKIISLSACCRELFPIIDMVRSMAEDTNLPDGDTTMNVSIHEDNSGALVLAQTLPPQLTPRSKYYGIKTIWFHKEIFNKRYQIKQD